MTRDRRHYVEFTDEQLGQFPPDVQEALTRLAWQETRGHRAPNQPGGFQVIDRGVTDAERARKLAERGGVVPHLVDKVRPGVNPVIPEDER